MATTKKTLEGWFDCGVRDNMRWMIVVCDSFDYEDYPVYSKDDSQEFWSKYASFDGKNMQWIMEVYDLSLDKNNQINSEYRAWNLPEKQ